jgi:hypothetical protein
VNEIGFKEMLGGLPLDQRKEMASSWTFTGCT